MPALQVRDFPDDLYDELREYAARNHRSIAQQTIACVENELKRSKAAEEGVGEEARAQIIELIPTNVREAWERARPVDSFAWLDPLGIESDEAREARLKKREQWKRDITSLHEHWDGSFPTGQDIAEMIREDRGERTDRIVAVVEGSVSRRKARS